MAAVMFVIFTETYAQRSSSATKLFCSWWRPLWLKRPTLNPFCHCYVKCSIYLERKVCHCNMSLCHIISRILHLQMSQHELSEGFSTGTVMRKVGFSGSSVWKTGLSCQDKPVFHTLEPENPTFLKCLSNITSLVSCLDIWYTANSL